MKAYNLENIRKGDKAMQSAAKAAEYLINSVLKAVVGMVLPYPNFCTVKHRLFNIAAKLTEQRLTL